MISKSPKKRDDYNDARKRLQYRLSVALEKPDLELTWVIPDTWSWFLDDPETKTRCRTLTNVDDIAAAIVPHCPRVAMGEIPECLHVRDALSLFEQGWRLAEFITIGASEDYPIIIPDHWHAQHEKLICVFGKGVFVVDGRETELYSQDVIDVPPEAIHGARLYHPTRVVAALKSL